MEMPRISAFAESYPNTTKHQGDTHFQSIISCSLRNNKQTNKKYALIFAILLFL